MKPEVRLLAATPILGYGFPEADFQKGLDRHPHLIAADGGSTDPGPYYLGSGQAFCSRLAMKRDLRIMLVEGVRRGIPVVVTTCGGAGGAPHLEMMADIAREIAQEAGLSFTMALIAAEQPTARMAQALQDGTVRPLSNRTPLTQDELTATQRIVALMGPEPIAQALQAGAQLVLTGRCTDPASWTAMALMHGIPPAQAWYAGKMLECGAEPALPKKEGCLFATVTEHAVDIEPLSEHQQCTVQSVANFSLRENASPTHHLEPGGTLRTDDCQFTAVSDRCVRITGMRWEPAPAYRVKLEGVRQAGYRAASVCGTRDPILIKNLDGYLTIAQRLTEEKLADLGVRPDQYRLHIHRYGVDGVMQSREPLREDRPHEIGFVIESLADTQELANTVTAQARISMLHADFPGRLCKEGNMAVLFSPSDFALGESYEFSLLHTLDVQDPCEVFPIHYEHVEG